MIVIERRNKIKDILFDKRSIKVTDLVREFLVSEETIRRDLHQLEKEGIVKKNYGGAMLVEELNKYELSVEQRQSEYHEEKDFIGRAAARLVEDGQIIILDAGSSTWYVTKHLHDVKDLMVISNALNVIDECSHHDTNVYVLGGKLRKNNMSMMSPQTEAELKNYNADFVFLGTSGIFVRKGFTSSDLYEAEIKRAMVSAGKKIVVLADHSKFEKAGLISFCHFKDIDILVTSERVDRSILSQIEQEGVEVILAPSQGCLPGC